MLSSNQWGHMHPYHLGRRDFIAFFDMANELVEIGLFDLKEAEE